MSEPGSRAAVLFVDDEPLVLQGLQRMLRPERDRWDMHFAASAEEALRLMAESPFDAVVSDLRMPGMDGAEFLACVMERSPQTVRIVLSGEMDRGLIFKTVQCAHQYLAKPCQPDALKSALERALALRRMIGDRRLKSLLPQLSSLPSLPALYFEILSEIQAPNASFKRVGELIARDVSLSAKMLQIVNSAFFGLPRRIADIAEAVSLLGFDTVKGLVLSVKVFSQFEVGRIPARWLEELWRHSSQVGLFARGIALSEKLPRRSLDEAFTAGLLHDVGKLIFAQNFPDAAVEMIAAAATRPLWEVESERFGVSHAELGAYLLSLWGIGEEVVAALAHHHRPPETGTPGRVVGVVYAANALEHRLGPGDAPGAPAAALGLEVCRRLNIAGRISAWEAICRKLSAEERLHA